MLPAEIEVALGVGLQTVNQEQPEDAAQLLCSFPLGTDAAVSRSLVDVLEIHMFEQPNSAAPPQLGDDTRLDRRRPPQHQPHHRVELPTGDD